jgi:hypothetical protein
VLGYGGPISKKEFAEKYKLSCECLSPKHVQVPRDNSLEEISEFFGPVMNNNGYNYDFTKDHLFIEDIETLWMVVHQKLYMPSSHLISLGLARGLACEKMGKNTNWAMYVEWTNSEQ